MAVVCSKLITYGCRMKKWSDLLMTFSLTTDVSYTTSILAIIYACTNTRQCDIFICIPIAKSSLINSWVVLINVAEYTSYSNERIYDDMCSGGIGNVAIASVGKKTRKKAIEHWIQEDISTKACSENVWLHILSALNSFMILWKGIYTVYTIHSIHSREG